MSKYIVAIRAQEQRERRIMLARIGTVFALCFLFWIVPAQDLHPVFIAVAAGLSLASGFTPNLILALLGLGFLSMFLSRKYYVLNAPDVAIRKTRGN
ncbi:MAG: hypothetical protein LC641_04140 [Spirochaeta sp.]|nr:hypothetical protein [Spirochaeta sp.]